MPITDMRTGTNEFVPEKDATKKLDDGREIVIARKGTPMPMAQAIEFGLVKDPAETKISAKKESSAPENKSEQPAAENKTVAETAGATTAPKGKGGKNK